MIFLSEFTMKRENCTSNKRQKSQLAITARATVLYSNLEWGILHFSSIFFSPTNPFTIIERRGDTKTFFFFLILILLLAPILPGCFWQCRIFSLYLYFIEVDSCSDNPCHFGGVCENGGSKCACAAGLQGDLCTEGLYWKWKTFQLRSLNCLK